MLEVNVRQKFTSHAFYANIMYLADFSLHTTIGNTSLLHCTVISDLNELNMPPFVCLFSSQGAPESLLDRCDFLRIGKETVTLTDDLKNQILEEVKSYGTG